MKNIKLEDKFIDERLMRNIAFISAVCTFISFVLLGVFHQLQLLTAFEKIVKIAVTLLIIWAFSTYHWDVMQGLMGALLFSLLYPESFMVLGKLWGETSDFDAFLVMGVQGSLFLAAQSMSFLMTIIIIINHFIIDYSRVGNFGNVIFNQISIIFKILLYVLLIIVNGFLNQSLLTQVNSALEYIADLCMVILIICIETQLDSFKSIRRELMKEKKQKEGRK